MLFSLADTWFSLNFLAFELSWVPANSSFSCLRDDFPDDFHDFRLILMILELFWDDFACWIHDFDGFKSFPRLGYGYRTSDMADMSSEMTWFALDFLDFDGFETIFACWIHDFDTFLMIFKEFYGFWVFPDAWYVPIWMLWNVLKCYDQITNAFYMCLPRFALTYMHFKAERSG